MKGKQIKTIKRICDLAKKRKAVWVGSFKHSYSAAFIQNWSAGQLQMMVDNGMIFEYIPKKK
jgi:hypothetical protein